MWVPYNGVIFEMVEVGCLIRDVQSAVVFLGEALLCQILPYLNLGICGRGRFGGGPGQGGY